MYREVFYICFGTRPERYSRSFMGKHPKHYSPGALILTFIPIEPHNIHLRKRLNLALCINLLYAVPEGV